jgi:hypothetical protein
MEAVITQQIDGFHGVLLSYHRIQCQYAENVTNSFIATSNEN